MKKLIAAVLLALITTAGFAQEKKGKCEKQEQCEGKKSKKQNKDHKGCQMESSAGCHSK